MSGTTHIPGKITLDESVRLAQLAKGKAVLQIGGYCGKGTLALAATAQRVWLVDDFLGYPGGRVAVAEEISRNVKDAGPEIDNRIDLVAGDTSDLSLAAPLPAIDLAYIDADRDPELIVQDIGFVRAALKQDALLVFHEGGRMVEQRIEGGYLMVGAA